MHRALLCLALLSMPAATAVHWTLALKDGTLVECDGAPLVINGEYSFRHPDGSAGSLPADQIDSEKTDRLNQTDRQQWRAVTGSARAAGSPAQGILALRDADFDANVLESDTPVMVEFWATWCGPCRAFEPTVKAIADSYSGRLRVATVDIDKCPATAKRFGVHAVPTVLFFKEGKIVKTFQGAEGRANVDRIVRAVL
jgi:thioredoxin 1